MKPWSEPNPTSFAQRWESQMLSSFRLAPVTTGEQSNPLLPPVPLTARMSCTTEKVVHSSKYFCHGGELSSEGRRHPSSIIHEGRRAIAKCTLRACFFGGGHCEMVHRGEATHISAHILLLKGILREVEWPPWLPSVFSSSSLKQYGSLSPSVAEDSI